MGRCYHTADYYSHGLPLAGDICAMAYQTIQGSGKARDMCFLLRPQ